MKKILLLSIFAVVLFACNKKDNPAGKGKLDPNAMVLLRPSVANKAAKAFSASAANWKMDVQGSPIGLAIVKNAVAIRWKSKWFSNRYYEEPKVVGRGFADSQRDLSIPALKMWGTDIITQDGDFLKDFVYGTDVYLTDNNNDTIGYIPQTVIDNARATIEAAYNAQNYTEVYRLFNEAFTFLPK
ncbi:MAG: hypothetical protein QM727_15420 [Niabella sp.]